MSWSRAHDRSSNGSQPYGKMTIREAALQVGDVVCATPEQRPSSPRSASVFIPLHMSVTPAASHTGAPLGPGIIDAPEPRTPVTPLPRLPPDRQSPVSRPPRRPRFGPRPTDRYPSAPATASPAARRPWTTQQPEPSPRPPAPTRDIGDARQKPISGSRHTGAPRPKPKPPHDAFRYDPTHQRLAPAPALATTPTVATRAQPLPFTRHPHSCALSLDGHLQHTRLSVSTLPNLRQNRQTSYP